MSEGGAVEKHGVVKGTNAAEEADRKAELTMARLVDGRYDMAARTGTVVALVVIYAILTIVGVWLRGRMVPAGWEVAAACGVLPVWAAVGPLLSWAVSARPARWVKSAELCEVVLGGRLAGETLTVVDEVMATIRDMGGRWRGTHLYMSRCTSTEEPDTGACQTAGIYPVNGRLIVWIGEHTAEGEPAITRATLAHERRHVGPVLLRVAWLNSLGRLFGWVIVGWAVPWPALLPAVLAFHVGMTVLSWAVEVICDVGAAAEAGPDAMLATLYQFSRTVERVRAARSWWVRYASIGFTWLAGPAHPPLPMRRSVIRLRWPQASTL
jgi:hypothetical protein